MRPQDHPEVIDFLAAQYVLGTLRGQARRRFEKWRANTPGVDERCRFWEDNLMPLAKGLRPIRPPPQVWQGIRARLNLSRRDQRRRGRPWAIAAQVAITVEQLGGSPTGQPTTTPIYVVPLRASS